MIPIHQLFDFNLAEQIRFEMDAAVPRRAVNSTNQMLYFLEPRVQKSSGFEPAIIELTLPETILASISGEAMILRVNVLYYHKSAYTLVPCEIMDEETDINGGDPVVKFTLEIEGWRLEDLDLNPYTSRGHAGFTGDKGEGEIVVVFSD